VSSRPAILTDDVDALVVQAASEVERALIRWALSLSPLDRLRAATKSAASLEALKNAKRTHG
jgi:hypothetical protein